MHPPIMAIPIIGSASPQFGPCDSLAAACGVLRPAANACTD
jgi:hypothetical protein